MTLSAEFVDQHIQNWSNALRSVYHPYREKWPSRLFHHSPLENAVAILRDGNLRSRNDRANLRLKDVAAAGVIDTRTHAHDYGRLYFRPRTPTQWHIEGIRKPGECSHGEDAHAPILVMMVFEAKRVLTREGVKFCDRNMQLGSAEIGDNEQYFRAIPFGKVFHEGGIGGDRSIIEHRCAEVLVMSPMPLDGTLQWIYCRTDAEKATLLHMLGPVAENWKNRIQISDDLQVFERRFVFVEKVTIDKDGVVAQFSPRRDLQKISVQVHVTNSEGERKLNFNNGAMDATPPAPSTRWRFNAKLPNGDYLVDIRLEGQLAFCCHMTVGQGVFL
jgi:ssDNA thymidine ADP-ribosyltransferase, DarT